MPHRAAKTTIAARRVSRVAGALVFAAAVAASLLSASAQPAPRPAAAVLLDRLCTHTMRPNEEDRLYALLSVTARTTIKYEGGVFSPDLIDDSVQDGLDDMLNACPQITKTADFDRLGMVVALIRDATIKRMQDPKAGYTEEATDKATAADLSEELSAPEIDAWLDALPARQRALALSLYASNATHDQIADAVGLPPGGLTMALQGVKGDLLNFFRANWEAAPPPPIPSDPPMEYREAGAEVGALMAPRSTSAASMRITGISRDIYAGWALLATVTGLASDRRLELDAPVLLEPDNPGHRRMIAVALDEMSDPHDQIRRFLVKAYAIDDDKEGSGLQDGFHLAAGKIDNPATVRTLANHELAAIEISRCLSYDYGTQPNPGLCQ